MAELAGKIALVTGGGHGIGRSISLALAAAGAHVVLAGRRPAPLEETAGEIAAAGGLAALTLLDVTDREQVEAVFEQTVANFGALDLLVNNAGRFRSVVPLWESDPDEWWGDLRTNLWGTYLCCRAALRHMVARRQGKIINMAGGGSLAPLPYATAYGASKTAVARLSETLQREAEEFGVNVYAIIPGLVRSEMTEFLMANEKARRFHADVEERMGAGRDFSPELAGKLCAFLAGPGGDRLGGRFLLAMEDYEEIARRADEVIAQDLYTLRRATLPGRTPPPGVGGRAGGHQ